MKTYTFISVCLSFCVAIDGLASHERPSFMTKMVKHSTVEIYTEAFGNAGNTPVLLIAGAMAPAMFWDTGFCQSLADRGYFVIRFDNRDIGKSTHFPQSAPESGVELPYSIHDMVADAKAVVDNFSAHKVHVIGHSLGGSIAQLFAVAYPEQTLSVTAISSPIVAIGDIPFVETDPKVTEELWAVLMANPMHQDVRKGVPEFQKVWRILNGDWVLDEAMAETYTRTIYETEVIGPAWNHTHVQSGIPDIFQDLRDLNKPILFVHGEKDYLASSPENIKRLAHALPNAEVFILKNGGHMFFNHDIWKILLEHIHNHINKAS